MIDNVETIRRIYAAFVEGEIPAILERLAETVQWEYGINSTDVPWLQPRSGRSEVAQFFEALQGLEFHTFQPKAFLSEGNLVVALIDVEATVKATGKRFVEEDLVHIWYFDLQGQVTRYRHRVDTHQHLKAYQDVL
jgi:uncharacterized protein